MIGRFCRCDQRGSGFGHHVHTLRHRYATRAYRATHDIEAVATLMGHSDVTTTQQYVQVGNDDLLRAARGVWAA